MKLIDILKEIEIKNKKIIGTGFEGNVYNVGKDKIAKYSNYTDGFDSEDIEQYNMFNKHPDLFPHIYKLTKHYVIMDRLDVHSKSISDVYDFLDDVDIWRDEDFIAEIFSSVKENDLETLNQILQKAKELNENEVYNTLKKCLEFCIKVDNFFKNEWIDFHSGNIGLDSKGDIKVFDL